MVTAIALLSFVSSRGGVAAAWYRSGALARRAGVGAYWSCEPRDMAILPVRVSWRMP